MKKSAMFIVAIAAAAHSGPRHVAPSAALIARAKRAATYQLKDPRSAMFRSLAVIHDHAGRLKVCGQVNSKNSYGGYPGFERFVYLPATEEVHFLSEGTDEWVDAYRGCYDVPG